MSVRPLSSRIHSAPFERIGRFVGGSGNDSITRFGRYDNTIHTNAGNAVLDPATDGASDPWVTVASKTGSTSWVGPATVAVAALQPVSIVGRQFFRFRLSSL